MIKLTKSKDYQKIVPVMLSRLMGLTGKPKQGSTFIVAGCTISAEKDLTNWARLANATNKDILLSVLIAGEKPDHFLALVERRPGPQIQIHSVMPCSPTRCGPTILIDIESKLAWRLNARQQLRRMPVPSADKVEAGAISAQSKMAKLFDLGPSDGGHWVSLDFNSDQHEV
jgi:hypothetical protein